MAYGDMVPKGISDLSVDVVPESGGFQTLLGSITNAVALLACKANEYAYEDPGLKNGVFSYYLVEALDLKVDNNVDYYTSAEEIFNYANPKVIQFTSNRQHPQIRDNYEGDLAMGFLCVVGIAEGAINVTPTLKDINGDGKQEVFLACDDGDGDGHGMAYAYDSDWKLIWSKKVKGNVRANPCVSDL
ncbi:MAG TPA: hypothetical protein EYP60_08680, partial [bacterium (Candidatus Stahlbacteria)]|nr:hypothetical protein [Candidatus Stahlbacteria bacterium]